MGQASTFRGADTGGDERRAQCEAAHKSENNRCETPEAMREKARAGEHLLEFRRAGRDFVGAGDGFLGNPAGRSGQYVTGDPAVAAAAVDLN